MLKDKACLTAPNQSKQKSIHIYRTREGAHHHFGYDPSPKTKSDESEIGESSTGGIFNLAFNTSGSVLAAACEAKTALLIDPGTRRTVADIGPNAHTQPGMY